MGPGMVGKKGIHLRSSIKHKPRTIQAGMWRWDAEHNTVGVAKVGLGLDDTRAGSQGCGQDGAGAGVGTGRGGLSCGVVDQLSFGRGRAGWSPAGRTGTAGRRERGGVGTEAGGYGRCLAYWHSQFAHSHVCALSTLAPHSPPFDPYSESLNYIGAGRAH